MVNSLSWILPFGIVMASLVDAVLVYVYMKYVHQWKDILSSEEVSNPELESQMEESNEPTIETPTEHSNDSSVESPIQISTEQPDHSLIEPPHSDSTIETSVTTIVQNIEPSNTATEETQIQVIEDLTGMYELVHDFLK